MESRAAGGGVPGGMFHSIYGTERFQGFTLPLERRGEVRDLIGERAERLAYLNCAMDRASFDRALDEQASPIGSSIGSPARRSSCRETTSTTCAACICTIGWNRCPAREWDYRRAAYRRMAERLGPAGGRGLRADLRPSRGRGGHGRVERNLFARWETAPGGRGSDLRRARAAPSGRGSPTPPPARPQERSPSGRIRSSHGMPGRRGCNPPAAQARRSVGFAHPPRNAAANPVSGADADRGMGTGVGRTRPANDRPRIRPPIGPSPADPERTDPMTTIEARDPADHRRHWP